MLRAISLPEFSHLEQIKIWVLLVRSFEVLGIQGCFNLFQVRLFRNIHTSNVHGSINATIEKRILTLSSVASNRSPKLLVCFMRQIYFFLSHINKGLEVDGLGLACWLCLSQSPGLIPSLHCKGQHCLSSQVFARVTSNPILVANIILMF